MGQREDLITKFFFLAAESWKEYKLAWRDGNMEKMCSAFDNAVKFLKVLHNAGYAKEVEGFLRKNEMPVRAILKKVRN